MTMTKPQFAVGDRVFSHYVMDWGTIAEIKTTDRGRVAHGNWALARILPPYMAARHGWGDDPRKREGLA